MCKNKHGKTWKSISIIIVVGSSVCRVCYTTYVQYIVHVFGGRLCGAQWMTNQFLYLMWRMDITKSSLINCSNSVDDTAIMMGEMKKKLRLTNLTMSMMSRVSKKIIVQRNGDTTSPHRQRSSNAWAYLHVYDSCVKQYNTWINFRGKS